MPKKRNNIEYQHCKTFANYLTLKRLRFSYLAQSTYVQEDENGKKNWGTISKNKAMGLNKGVPDYIIILNIGLIFVEMKAPQPYKSEIGWEQSEWIEALNGIKGVEAKVCYGSEEAINFIESFL